MVNLKNLFIPPYEWDVWHYDIAKIDITLETNDSLS